MTELVFKGKEFVFNHHLTVPFRPLEMHAEKGIGAPSLDGNLIIQGDNLHALKALLPTYAGKVDCIFIDPPYNTGNEGWSYNDNVNSPMIKEWLNNNPIGVEDGLRHDKWACMMWPRLRLLRELLSEDGSLWMTIDDNESHNARELLDEIFGQENFISNIIWQKRFSPSNDELYISATHDNMLVYAKKKNGWVRNLLPRTAAQNDLYANPDDDERDVWASDNYVSNKSKSERPNSWFPIVRPADGKEIWPSPTSVWRYSPEQHAINVAENKVWWGESGMNNVPRFKRFLSEIRDGVVPQTLWFHGEVGHNQGAKQSLNKIFPESELPFQTPKPVELIDRVIRIAAGRDAIILDSFAGSGTTAHAVLAANVSDGGSRRVILVEGEDYADTLTAERVRRVIKGYKFTGTQREELLREPLTWTKLRNANALLEKVQRTETLDGPRYDRIAKTVKDGSLIVTGERDVEERTEGLGGTFTYCTLGAPVDMDALLTGKDLPSVEAMAALLFHTATAKPFEAKSLKAASAIGEGVYGLGEGAGRTLWLIYKPDLDWLKSAAAALTLTRARAIAATAPGDNLVFAPAKFVSRELLASERLAVEYAPLPFALYRVEAA